MSLTNFNEWLDDLERLKKAVRNEGFNDSKIYSDRPLPPDEVQDVLIKTVWMVERLANFIRKTPSAFNGDRDGRARSRENDEELVKKHTRVWRIGHAQGRWSMVADLISDVGRAVHEGRFCCDRDISTANNIICQRLEEAMTSIENMAKEPGGAP